MRVKDGILMTLWAVSAVHAQDVLHLQDGTVYRGRVINLASSQVQMEVQLPGVAGSAQRRFDTHEVDFIDFAPLPGEREALADPASPTQQQRLLEIWQEKSVHLNWPTNNAGEIGLVCAQSALDSGEDALVERAHRIYSLIEKDDWDEARRSLAQQGRLRALIRLKRVDEAIREAQVIAREAEDPALMIEAQQVLAAADFQKLKTFEEENPRWDQDEELTEARWALYHQTLDQFLNTPLFHGSVEGPSASSLWQVVQVHLHAKEPLLARQRAEDLTHLYPRSSEAEKARALLGPSPAAAADSKP